MQAEIERIVVALDASADNRTPIDTAVRLASQAKAPLHGIFVEDQDIFHLAGLPFAHQVTIGTGRERLTQEDVALQLRAQAVRVRRQLCDAARQNNVTYTFEVIRGELGVSLASARPRDLVVAAERKDPVAGAFHSERLRSAIEAGAGSILLTRVKWASEGSVVTLLRDRDVAASRMLAAVAQIAAARHCPLHVICAADGTGTKSMRRWGTEHISPHGPQAEFEIVTDGPEALYWRLIELDCRLLALQASALEEIGDELRRVTEHVACDMLIVP